jgi:hypothetical protein
MVEKIRVSLWDIFSFFFTGFLATLVLVVFFVIYGSLALKELFNTLSTFPAVITLAALPLAFTLLGMVIEPFANYVDKVLELKYILGWVSKLKEKHNSEEISEEKFLKDEIRNKYMGYLNGKIDNPFAICKEYVETKQLSATFMVFLSRYGFYRNCAFISIASGVAVLFFSATWYDGTLAFLILVVASAVFKLRAKDFYSYQAPAVYRAFLIDKVSWVPDNDG